MKFRNLGSRYQYLPFVVLTVGLVLPFYQNMEEPNNDRAVTMFTRLTGKIPTDAQVSQMNASIAAGDPVQAAKVATADPGFINVTVRGFCAQMSTRQSAPNALLNDFTATCMGIIRDNTPVTDFTTANYYYRIDPARVPASLGVKPINPDDPANTAALYQTYFNFPGEDLKSTHYQVLNGVDFLFDLGSALTLRKQQYYGWTTAGDFNHGSVDATYPNPEPAGLITTTTFLLQHAVAGTNRRLVQYVLHDFECKDPADYADNGLLSGGGDDTFVGPDIDRFPGGSHTVYETSCKACHGILDGMRGAFAYNDTDGGANMWPILYRGHTNDRGQVVTDKYERNSQVYPAGHRTIDDTWTNLATVGQNAQMFGWRGATSGKGVSSFGQMIARSKGFSRCMVKRAFESVCGRTPSFSETSTVIEPESDQLEANSYNLRRTFERLAATPACIESFVTN